MKKRLPDSHGFTLIEMIVVLLILTILAGILIPSFTGYIHRLQIREIVQIAKANEKTGLELAGMQYAQIGNPYISDPGTGKGQYYDSSRTQRWNTGPTSAYVLDENTLGDQYIYSDGYCLTNVAVPNASGGTTNTDLLRFSVANSYADTARRVSEGLNQYQNRMAQPLMPATFLTTFGNYGYCGTWLWFKSPTTAELNRMNNSANPYYYHYDLIASEYWYTFNGKNYGVFHNLQFDNTTASIGHADNRSNITITPGWFVYEYRSDGKWYYFGVL